MRNSILTFGLLPIIFVASVAQQAENTRSNLAVVITSDRTDYSLADTIQLDIHIMNVGKSPLTIYGRLLWGYAGGLVLHVSDTLNREIPAKGLDDDLVIPSTVSDRNSYVVLNKYHFLGTIREDLLSDHVVEPGIYFIQVEYRSPIPHEMGLGPNFWGREQPAVWSGRIQIHVISNPKP
jgi:hypothetical protein